MTEGSPTPAESKRVQFHWGTKIPLRDGIRLNATVYIPERQSAPAPCIFTLTPYISDTYHERGVYFAKHGLPFLIVDVRGRGNSEGVFNPLVQEAKDGYDVVEWLAGQPYCDGQVAMWGGSYAGYDQWATAKEFPPHLATVVPVAAPYPGLDFPMRNNIFYPYDIQWITFTSGRASQNEIFWDESFWASMFREWFESGRPFRDLDTMVGNPSAIFRTWLAHPEPDEYWDAHNPSADQYSRLTLPILTITGSYDDDQPGALEHYKQHVRNASPPAAAQHHLVIGPWDHWGTRTPRPEFGGLEFGPSSLVDLPKLHLDWYRWRMQGGPKPAFLKKSVAYYVMGAEHWRYADTLEQVTARYETYWLDSAGDANDVFSSGSIGPRSGKGPPDKYVFDPRVTDGPEVAAEANSRAGTLTDQSVTLALRGKQFVYHSATFETDTEVSGFFRLSAWIAIDCPDTDLYVSVHEIALNGSSIRLSTDAIRARYREGRRSARLIETNEPLRYDFNLTFVSRQVKRSHRLRLVLAPVGRLIDNPFGEKNYNSGGAVADESSTNARPVTVTLFHDEGHQSALYVPIGDAESPDEP